MKISNFLPEAVTEFAKFRHVGSYDRNADWARARVSEAVANVERIALAVIYGYALFAVPKLVGYNHKYIGMTLMSAGTLAVYLLSSRVAHMTVPSLSLYYCRLDLISVFKMRATISTSSFALKALFPTVMTVISYALLPNNFMKQITRVDNLYDIGPTFLDRKDGMIQRIADSIAKILVRQQT